MSLVGLPARLVSAGGGTRHPSRPVITAFASSITTRSAGPGGCSGKKRTASPRQKRLPEALSEGQVRQLLSGIRNPVHKTCLTVMYGVTGRFVQNCTLSRKLNEISGFRIRPFAHGDG